MQRDAEFQELMEVAQQQGKVHEEMQVLEKEVEKRDSDIQQLQKQLKEAEHILVGASWADRGGEAVHVLGKQRCSMAATSTATCSAEGRRCGRN